MFYKVLYYNIHNERELSNKINNEHVLNTLLEKYSIFLQPYYRLTHDANTTHPPTVLFSTFVVIGDF